MYNDMFIKAKIFFIYFQTKLEKKVNQMIESDLEK